jgi:hypothetical protein
MTWDLAYCRRQGEPTQLLCLVGPFWPMMAGVTYPLIFIVSAYSAFTFLPFAPVWVSVIWCMMTVTAVGALALTACSNPGIVRRYTEEPAGTVSSLNTDNRWCSRYFTLIIGCGVSRRGGGGATKLSPSAPQTAASTETAGSSSKSLTTRAPGRSVWSCVLYQTHPCG